MNDLKYSFVLCLLAMMVFISSSAQAHVTSYSYFVGNEEHKITVPEDLLDQIQKKFGDFSIASKNDYCSQFKQMHDRVVDHKIWSYGVLADDFDQDGLMDYSLIIRTKETLRYVWVLAMRTTHLRRNYLLTDMGWPSLRHFNQTSYSFDGKMCEGAMVLDKPAVGYIDNRYPPLIGLEAHGRSTKVYWRDGELYEFDRRPAEYVPWYYSEDF